MFDQALTTIGKSDTLPPNALKKQIFAENPSGTRNMKRIALIVRHQTKPGMRNRMRAIWETYIQSNVRLNPGHVAYYFCYDSDNSDGITAFQIFTSLESKEQFLKSQWYPEYLKKVSEFISQPPQITTAEVLWDKNEE